MCHIVLLLTPNVPTNREEKKMAQRRPVGKNILGTTIVLIICAVILSSRLAAEYAPLFYTAAIVGVACILRLAVLFGTSVPGSRR